MIEEVVIAYLSQRLSAPVVGSLPEDFPMTFVSVEKTGSYVRDHIVTETLAIQSWADTQYNAAVLNKAVKAAMPGLLELDCIGRVKLNTDYNYTDTTTKRQRYQAVYEVVYYEEDLNA